MLACVAATLSRAGFAALLIGLATLAVLLGGRGIVRAMAPPAAGAAVAMIGLLPAMPATSPARPALGTVALVLGASVSWWLARAGHVPRGRVWLAVGAASIVLLVLAVSLGDPRATW
jgi:hypothetical protein